ncbi:hypothetical protein ACFLVN_03670 [Chloroflexota bacterium]
MGKAILSKLSDIKPDARDTGDFSARHPACLPISLAIMLVAPGRTG